jgi:site-specific DNA-methyltransferase (adenine-specific)
MIQLIHGDCLEEMKKIPDGSIDLVLTDPPYGINYQSNMRTVSKKFDIIANDNNDMRFVAYNEYQRVLKDNTCAVIFCSWKNFAVDFLELQKLFNIKNVIIWNKGGGGIGDLKHSLLTDYEIAIVAHKGRCKIRGKRDGSVWSHKKVNPNKMVHPTEKPLDLMERLVEKFTDTDCTILDTFMGSGVVGVACKNLNRNFIGIELDKDYFEIAKKRIGV